MRWTSPSRRSRRFSASGFLIHLGSTSLTGIATREARWRGPSSTPGGGPVGSISKLRPSSYSEPSPPSALPRSSFLELGLAELQGSGVLTDRRLGRRGESFLRAD